MTASLPPKQKMSPRSCKRPQKIDGSQMKQCSLHNVSSRPGTDVLFEIHHATAATLISKIVAIVGSDLRDLCRMRSHISKSEVTSRLKYDSDFESAHSSSL